jgi:CheY-like chemotaxis protein
LIRLALKEARVETQIEVIESGDDAMRRLDAPPNTDLVLLDLNLPGYDGFDILKAMTSHTDWLNVPVVIITSSNCPEDLHRAQELGVSRYMVKPPDLQGFLDLGGDLHNLLIPN